MKKVMMVIWQDSMSDGHWSDTKSLDDHAPGVAMTLGFCVKEDKSCIVIASTYMPADDVASVNEQACNIMCIPKGAILEIFEMDTEAKTSPRYAGAHRRARNQGGL